MRGAKSMAAAAAATAVLVGAMAVVARGGDDAAKAEVVSLKTVPPVVVTATPQAGTGDVDAGTTTEIKVVFSKDMADSSWSWSTLGEENFPDTTGKPHYAADHRTCVLPVKLRAGKTYAIGLNSNKFHNFRDADGHAAVPYLLVFATKP